MKVVILCGGESVRLKEATESVPKALVEIGGKPIIWHIMKIYHHYGFKDFILCLGYKGDAIKKYFMEDKWRGNDFSLKVHQGLVYHSENFEDWNITFVDTGPKSPKSQRLQKVKDFIDKENFFLAYGDDLADVDINKLKEFHESHNKIATITAVKIATTFGIVDIDDKDDVTSFKEKPMLDYWMNGGFMVLNKKIFDYLHLGELEEEVFGKLVEEKQKKAFKHFGEWKTMNTLKDTNELNKLWEEGKAFWKKW